MASADAKLVAYAARIAEALSAVKDFDAGYGTFYISKVEIEFGGDSSGVRVVANEHGEFDVEID